MTDESEPNEPNDFGFAGDPTGPEPRKPESTGDVDGESIAVPGDAFGALEELTDTDKDDKSR
jgi:hypothetical protein